MPSLIEILRHWAHGDAAADTIAVRIYRNGHLVSRDQHTVSRYGCGADKFDVGAFTAANNITAALLGRARRAAKMECRN